MTSPLHDYEALLAEDDFIRSVARSLIVDVHAAEDVAQETWVRLLEARPHAHESLRSWLYVVARNVALDSGRILARRGRAQDIERGATLAAPSTAQIIEREAVRRAVVMAVLELDEIYRTPMILRYMEGLPPRAIARHLRLPTETVRTRIKRGLSQLRRRLDPGDERSRSAFVIALLAIARKPRVVPDVSRATPRTIAWSAAAGVGAVAAGVAVLRWISPATPVRGDERIAARPGAPAAPRPSVPFAAPSELPLDADSPESPRAQVASTPDASGALVLGSLAARAVWADTGLPAAAVPVRVAPTRGTDIELQVVTTSTDSSGSFHVAGLAPGEYEVWLRGGSAHATVGAALETQATFSVPAGFAIRGAVVDSDGAAVAGAEVWLADLGDPLRAAPAAHSGPDGSFEIVNACAGYWNYLGARKPGWAPSRLSSVVTRDGDANGVRLVLPGPGGAVEGTVVGPLGESVPGARVWLGSGGGEEWSAAGDLTLDAPPQFLAVTDAAGAFRIDGLAPGLWPIAVRTRGLAAWSGEVDVTARGVARLDLRLEPGCVLSGTVEDAAGTAVADVWVGTGRRGDSIAPSTWTDETGAYRLEGLARGEVEVQADGGLRGLARTTVALTQEAPSRWDVALSRGHRVAGRVVDEAGVPVEGVVVAVESPHGREEARRVLTAADGSFEIPFTGEGRCDLAVFETEGPPFRIGRVRARAAPAQDVLVCLPSEARASAAITGSVELPRADSRSRAEVVLWRSGEMNGEVTRCAPDTGAFRFAPLPPGEYRVEVKCDGRASWMSPMIRIGAGEERDLGRIALDAAGSLLVSIDGPPDVCLRGVRIDATSRPHGRRERFDVEGREVRCGSLAPGEHLLTMHGPTIRPARAVVDIRAGEVAAVRFELEPAPRREIRLALANESGETPKQAHLWIFDAGGELLADEELRAARTGQLAWELGLADGSYRAAALGDDGKLCKFDFVLDAATLRVELK